MCNLKALRFYSLVVEHLTVDQEVTGLKPVQSIFLIFSCVKFEQTNKKHTNETYHYM